MNIRTTLRMFFAVCILGFIIVIIESRDRGTGNKGIDQKTALTFNPDDVEKIVIDRKGLFIECVRKDGIWFINRPLRAKADVTRMNHIVGVLDSLKQYELVMQKEMQERELSYADYGLDKPSATIVLEEKLASHQILVGSQSAFGGRVYLRVDGSNDIVVTSADILDIIPAKVGDLRDRTVFRGEPDQISRIQIKRPGAFIELVSGEKGWMISQPIADAADDRIVKAMIGTLLRSRIIRFVWDADGVTNAQISETAIADAGKSTVLAPYGLGHDEAFSSVTLWSTGDDTGHELLIGKNSAQEPAEAYARLADVDSVFTIPVELTGLLAASVDDLRSRNILPHLRNDIYGLSLESGDRKIVLARSAAGSWNVVEPVRVKGDDDIVGRLMDNILNMRISAFDDANATAVIKAGMHKPRLTLKSCTNAAYVASMLLAPVSNSAAAVMPSADDAGWYSVLIGGADPVRDITYVRCGTNPALFEVETKVIAPILADPCNPLAYMDRQIISLNPADIIRLVITKSGRRQSVELNDAGKWVAGEGQSTNSADAVRYTVNQNIVDDLLLALTDVRAARIESAEPANPSAYGFDSSETTISAVMKGDKALQKTLILGFRAGTDGIYAMVRGTDVLFVLDDITVKVLTRDLIKREQPAPVELK